MEEKYREWIKQNVPQSVDRVVGTCKKYSKLMLKDFPELILVRGHVKIPGDYNPSFPHGYPHFWLKTSVGEIVDPTKKQFGTFCIYEEWNETGEEPTGKCPNCGEYCYRGRYCCSEKCEKEYIAYCSSPYNYD